MSFCSGGQTGLTRLADGAAAAGDDGMFCGDAVALASISMKIERDCLPRPKQYNELIMCPHKEKLQYSEISSHFFLFFPIKLKSISSTSMNAVRF